ncbi:MAG: VWA domain-containing protein [Gemmatimonadota bacterium]|nr:VWA domain-containing protein [Gemmatimonadota bacterium]
MTSTEDVEPGRRFRADRTAWIAALCGDLRGAGLAVSLSESVLASECARHLDADDPVDVHLGLRAAFCGTDTDLAVFDRCFWLRWRGIPGLPPEERSGSGPTTVREGGGRVDRPVAASGARGETGRGPIGTAYSAADHLSRRSFASVDRDELRELDRLIDRLVITLSSRRSRRLEPGGRRGIVDLRRSAGAALRTDGEWIRLAHRRRRRDPPRLVVLCDISGSMERYSRFLVRFLLATGRSRDIETFAFSTRLTHLTPWLARRRVDEALDELRARGWSSGTRIGECLERFVERYGRSLLGRRTIVVILSDGLDQGEVEPLERAMRRIQRRARRVIWLNPLLESSRYAPEARGMRAALPFVDEFASGHDLAALRRLPDLLRL